MSIAQPPVLRRVTEPSIDQIVETLKSVNSGVNKLSPSSDKLLVKVDTIKSIVQNIENLLSNNTVSTEKQKSDAGKTRNKKQVVEKPAKEVLEEKQSNLFQSFAFKIQAGWEVVGEKISKLKDAFMNSNFVKGTKDLLDSTIRGLLGPLNLIFEPLSEAFGINFTEMIGKLFGKDDNPKNKGKKVKPTDSDVKQANPETYWLWKKVFGKKDEKEKGGGIGGFFGKIFGGMSFAGIGAKILKKLNPMLFSKIVEGLKNLFTFIFKGNLFENIGNLLSKTFPKLIGKKFISIFSKAGPIAMIVGGLAMAVKDGIKGLTQGWKTSKVSNFTGSFLGGVDKGIKGAFKNMGKWALIGAGVGSFVPVVGTVLGGILGAVVGGILGFIGGENIAKGLDAVGNFFYDKIFSPIKDVAIKFGNWINEKAIQPLLEKIQSIISFVFEKIIDPISNTIKKIAKWFYKFFMIEQLLGFFKKAYDKTVKKLINVGSWIKNSIINPLGKFIKSIFDKALSGISNAVEWVKEVVLTPVASLFSKIWEGIKDVAAWGKEHVFTPIADFVVSIFDKLKETVPNLFNKYIISPIEKTFSFISDLFGFIFSGEINIVDVISGVTKGGRESLGKKYAEYTQTKQSESYEAFENYMRARDRTWDSKLDSEKIQLYKNADLKKLGIAKVNDAIITPSGRIIQPSSDDTIIATKSPVSRQKKGFDSNDMQIDLSQLSKSIESSSKGNEIVSSLRELIETIKNKPFNNVVQNNEVKQTDFDKLRFAL